MENPINRWDLESMVVKLVNGSAVTQTKLTRSGFHPFKGRLYCPLLILKDGVFLSVIVNEFKFIYLASSSVFHGRSPLGGLFKLQVDGLVHLENPAMMNDCCQYLRTVR
jgi:hypothetical protein